jgi:hypothetical protein
MSSFLSCAARAALPNVWPLTGRTDSSFSRSLAGKCAITALPNAVQFIGRRIPAWETRRNECGLSITSR